MWLIIKADSIQVTMVNRNGDDILASLQAHYPGSQIFKHTSDADHQAALDYLGALIGDPPEIVGNTCNIVPGSPPTLQLKDPSNTVASTQTLVDAVS